MYLIISFFFELDKLGVNDNMWDFNFTNFFIFSDEKIIRGTVSGFGSMLGFETATRLKNREKSEPSGRWRSIKKIYTL